MNNVQVVFLMAVGLSAGQASDNWALHQFRAMILCMMPDSWPIFDYADYGCHCGKGGGGTPVDDLDRCCQVHDQCYKDAIKHPDCWPLFDHPYAEIYYYSCDKLNRKVTCKNDNDPCEMFICECDRSAAQCFARSHWNPEHEHLPSEHCNRKSPSRPIHS